MLPGGSAHVRVGQRNHSSSQLLLLLLQQAHSLHKSSGEPGLNSQLVVLSISHLRGRLAVVLPFNWFCVDIIYMGLDDQPPYVS